MLCVQVLTLKLFTYAETMSNPTFTLSPPPDAAAFDALQRSVLGALDEGFSTVSIRLDHLRTLDVAAMRQLIKLLRRTRERGGDLELLCSRPDILRSLRVTALDKVFRMAPAPAVAA